MDTQHKPVSVWYFIGWLLLIYGFLILGAGLQILSAQAPPVLPELNAGTWWGALLIIIGLVYVSCFRRTRHR